MVLLAITLLLAAQLVSVNGLHCEASPEFQELERKAAHAEKMIPLLQSQIQVMENKLQALEKTSASGQGKSIGFHAVLRPARLGLGHTYGQLGPFSYDKAITYGHVITNVGNNYNPNTGLFTAPVNGLYSFAFTTTSYGLGQVLVGVQLMRNNEEVAFAAYYRNPSDSIMSNSAVLALIKGDSVHVRLCRGCQVSSSMRHMTNTFSGFLIHVL